MCYVFNIFIVSVGDIVSVLLFCQFPVYIFYLYIMVCVMMLSVAQLTQVRNTGDSYPGYYHVMFL
jgi:cytochrome c biogenesis factor